MNCDIQVLSPEEHGKRGVWALIVSAEAAGEVAEFLRGTGMEAIQRPLEDGRIAFYCQNPLATLGETLSNQAGARPKTAPR